MTEQVFKVLGKLDERNTRSTIWVTSQINNLFGFTCEASCVTKFKHRIEHFALKIFLCCKFILHLQLFNKKFIKFFFKFSFLQALKARALLKN